VRDDHASYADDDLRGEAVTERERERVTERDEYVERSDETTGARSSRPR
jgi:hypothetical protein